VTALAAALSFEGRSPTALCDAMLAAQAVLAPEPPVYHAAGPVCLGRRLRPLLPEDRYDRGPAVLRAGRLVLVADVRLDNREELAGDLSIGSDQAAMADSLLLAHALDRWGMAALDRVLGDFAFILWDADRRALMLGRDYSGQRPLHVHWRPGFVACASMPRGLHALDEIPRRPSRTAAVDMVLGRWPAPDHSFFEHVQAVPAGHLVHADRGGLRTERWWQPVRRRTRYRSPAECHEAVRAEIDRAVAAQLRRAAGGVGAHLSAGLDSAAVTATAARLLAGRGESITALTAVPTPGPWPRSPNRIEDESAHAAHVAALHPNIDHQLVSAGDRSPLANLPRNLSFWERPVPNLHNDSWWGSINDICAARGIALVLIGAMGNLSTSYAGDHLVFELLRSARFARLVRELRWTRRRSGMGWRRVVRSAAGPFVPAWLRRAPAPARGFLRAEALAAASPAEPPLPFGAFAARVARIPRADPGSFNKGALIGWGIDQRDPLADRLLVELLLAVPTEFFHRHGEPRALARHAFADRLPTEVRLETRKGYQGADWYLVLQRHRQAVLDEIDAIAAAPAAEAVLDTAAMRREVEAWPAEQPTDPAFLVRNRGALMRAIAAGHFLRHSGKLDG
jgi:asparagine synthase (glutamine-hydrolysing)